MGALMMHYYIFNELSKSLKVNKNGFLIGMLSTDISHLAIVNNYKSENNIPNIGKLEVEDVMKSVKINEININLLPQMLIYNKDRIPIVVATRHRSIACFRN